MEGRCRHRRRRAATAAAALAPAMASYLRLHSNCVQVQLRISTLNLQSAASKLVLLRYTVLDCAQYRSEVDWSRSLFESADAKRASS